MTTGQQASIAARAPCRSIHRGADGCGFNSTTELQTESVSKCPRCAITCKGLFVRCYMHRLQGIYGLASVDHVVGDLRPVELAFVATRGTVRHSQPVANDSGFLRSISTPAIARPHHGSPSGRPPDRSSRSARAGFTRRGSDSATGRSRTDRSTARTRRKTAGRPVQNGRSRQAPQLHHMVPRLAP